MKEIRPEEISALIKEQIKNYGNKIQSDDVGYVISVGDGIAMVQGIDKAMSSELLDFGHDIYGMVLNLEEDHIGAVLLGDDSLIKEGDEVRRTGRVVEVPVGDALLGRVVNALGQPVDGKGPVVTDRSRQIERLDRMPMQPSSSTAQPNPITARRQSASTAQPAAARQHRTACFSAKTRDARAGRSRAFWDLQAV